MRKTKEQKGITLIALIITIIVLLILAVVAIGAVQNDGIINHAKNARDEYEKAETNEETTLGGYISKIEGSISSGSGETEAGGAEYEAISVETDCIKYYVNLDKDEDPEGIIYIDKANTVSGSWRKT